MARLPRRLAGVVFRHDHDPDRVSLGRDIAKICRARGLLLVVAGDVRLAAALRAGVHLRGGRWPGNVRINGLATSWRISRRTCGGPLVPERAWYFSHPSSRRQAIPKRGHSDRCGGGAARPA